MYIGTEYAELGFASSRWYTINEFNNIMRNFYASMGLSRSEINNMLQMVSSPPSSIYSISGNSLTITTSVDNINHTIVYNRR